MNIDDCETHNVSTLARRLLVSRAKAGRLLAFGGLKPAKETHTGAFYRKDDLDRLREEEIGRLREKCAKLNGTEREKMAAFFSEITALENGRDTPTAADEQIGRTRAAAGLPQSGVVVRDAGAMLPKRMARSARVSLKYGDGAPVELKESADGIFRSPQTP